MVDPFAQLPWKQIAVAAAVSVFAIAMVGCAERAWHAPHPPVLFAIWVLGVGLGVGVVLLRSKARAVPSKKRDPTIDIATSSAVRIVLASILGGVSGTLGAALVALMIEDWKALALASVVGSLTMATYPLLVLAAHVALERRLIVGIDAVRVGRREVPLRAIRAVTVETANATIAIAIAGGTVLRYRCASGEIAQDIADRIAARIVCPGTTPRVDRGVRSLEEWRRALLTSDYRATALSREDADRILSAGSVSAEERVGAALVLVAHESDNAAARARVASAASACLDRKLRVALERVADGTLDDAALDEATRAVRS